MLHLLRDLRDINAVAVSGGVDSMVLYHYLKRTRDVKAFFFHHNTEASEKALHFLLQIIPDLVVGRMEAGVRPGKSKEAEWRNARYGWLHSLPYVIATAHHLNDVAETWLMTATRGKPKLILQSWRNIRRPLLLSSKRQIEEAAKAWAVPFIEDESNKDVAYARNRVRNNIMPELLKVNPGFLTHVRGLVLNSRGVQNEAT